MKRFIFSVLSACLTAIPAAGMGSERLLDIDGRHVTVREVTSGAHGSVLLFLRTDCPVSNRYAPEIRRLFGAFSRQGVAFWLVYPNPAEPAAAIRDHVQTFGYPGHVVRDPDHVLVRLASATITPEAAVVDPRGRVVYHGRIDDRFANLGVDRQTATEHTLEDALAATLLGNPVRRPVARAVGCFITDLK